MLCNALHDTRCCHANPYLLLLYCVALPAAINQQQEQEDPDQQRLLGRRLLQALVKVWGEKSKNNNGQRMCFYAQELNPKLGRARGLDLHSVAARLEKGLYAAAGEPLEVCVHA